MATTQRRGLPYLFVTWLAKYLAGENQCLWALWFQSRYKFDAVKSDFDVVAWSAEHDAMVTDRATVLTSAGYDVTLENENYFQVNGETASIAGKMDLKAVKGPTVIILEGKTGAQRRSDWWQVLIYTAMLPMVWKRQNLRVSGEVFYKNGTSIRVEPEELTAEHRNAIVGLAKQIGMMTEPPPKTPSALECRFCKISRNDCSARIEEMAEVVAETVEF